MTSIPPSAPPPSAPAAPAAPAAAEAVPVLPLPPDIVAKLAVVRQLAAIVEANAQALANAAQQQNVVTVRTELGTLTLKLPVPVQPGAQLLLTVVKTGEGEQPTLRLAMVDGKPLPMLSAAASPKPQAQSVTLDPAVTVSTPKAAADQPITATVLRAVPTDQAAAPRLPQGGSFPVRIVSIEPPGTPATIVERPVPTPAAPAAPQPAATPTPTASPAPQPTVPTPSVPAAATPTAPTPAVQPSTTPATSPVPTPQPGQAAAPASAVPTPAPATAAPPPPLPAQISGVVAPNSHAGQPILQTPLGLVSLGTSAPLPPTATVVLEITGPLASAPSVVATPASPAAPAPWSALGEALTALRQADPAAAERLAAALPQLGPKLASGMLVFGAALQAERLKAVVGEGTAQALEKLGKRELARKLIKELGDEPVQQRAGSGDWRAATLPMLNGDIIEPVRLFLRKPPEELGEGDGKGGGASEGTRFVVEVTLSRFGRIQLDGLVKRRAKQFDMILRTGEPMPEDMRRDIQALFAKYCDGLGLTGVAAFRAGGGAFVEPAPPPAETVAPMMV